MITDTQLAALAEKFGFTAWTPLDIQTIVLKPEVRDMCAGGSCKQYAKRWSCPPGCGSLAECGARVARFSRGILVQTVGDVEDSFDYEAMMEIQETHKARFEQMHQEIRRLGEPVLALGAGCCTRCKTCTYPDAPCRFPEQMVSSMEAYGILVLEVCKDNGLQYYYGSDKMAYTSCFLL
jgi:predicted metal-binding protein